MKETINKLKWIYKKSKPGIITLTVATIIGSILSAISVYNAMISKSLIDSAISKNLDSVIKWLVVMGSIMLSSILLGTLRSFLSTYSSNKILNELQKEYFSHLAYSEWMELSKFHSAGLMTRITSDTSTINNFICGTIPSIITSIIMLGISFFTLLKIEPNLAIFTIVILPIIGLINKLCSRKLKKFYKDIQDKNIEYTSFVQESLQNLMIVKTFCNEKKTINNLDRIQNQKLKLSLKQSLFTSLTGMLFSIGSSAAYFVVFCWGALSLVKGAITFGTMTALLQLFNKIEYPLSSLMGCYSPIISSLAATERLMEIESLALEKGTNNMNVLISNKPVIKLDNVSFGYKEDVNILKNISCTINPGETIAIVGPSGQGKTTLIRLLLSLIHPENGDIHLKNNNFKELLSKNHRNLISYIPQGNTLFSGTITENLLYGNKDATYEDILKACELSCSLDFINKLDEGFDTKIGEKGLGLSEGQAQRIAIARAFLRTKPILILDEATSALDEKTEVSVLESIKNLEHKPTCIIITHRPKALSICDRILKLDNGYLTEEDRNDIPKLEISLA